jgi:2-polyprenyl-3-methyl-5-hydroxy-6-metoxy-1,4-benzoquinol methylase
MKKVDNYGWNNSAAPNSSKYIAPRILNILKMLNVNSVCDLGCGNGSITKEIYAAGYNVVGIDGDAEGVRIAREASPGIKFHCATIDESSKDVIAMFGAKIDLVLTTEVIEHLYLPSVITDFSSKVLKPHGYLVITTPYHGYLKNLFLSLFNKWDFHHTVLWDGGHIKFWSYNTIKKFLENNGFEMLYFGGVGRCRYLWKSMVVVARLEK